MDGWMDGSFAGPTLDEARAVNARRSIAHVMAVPLVNLPVAAAFGVDAETYEPKWMKRNALCAPRLHVSWTAFSSALSIFLVGQVAVLIHAQGWSWEERSREKPESVRL